MLKITIGIFAILLLVSSLGPRTRGFLNEKVLSIFVGEARERAEERQLIGSTNNYSPRVKEIQRILKDAGFSLGPIDGKIGRKTRSAIREFQKAKGLKVTGIINSETLLELNQEKEAQVTLKRKREEIFLQDKGKQIQRALRDAGFSLGPIDGKIGRKTRSAIREFQKAKGLNPHGIVDEKTWLELKRYLR